MSAYSRVKPTRNATVSRSSIFKFPAIPSLRQMFSQMTEETGRSNVVKEARKEVNNKKVKSSPPLSQTRKRKHKKLTPVVEEKVNAKKNLPPLKGTRKNPSAVAIGGKRRKSCHR